MDEMSMVRVVDLTKEGEDGTLLSAVSFSFSKKGVHGILGPGHSGKTALLEILSGNDPDFTGSVTMADRSVEGDPALWKRKLGYVPGEPVLDAELTVEEIMELCGRARGVAPDKLEKQMAEALSLVGLSELHRRQVGRMRAGQVKTLTLAAALLGNPDVLLLDEPTAGLRTEERETMMGLIRMLGTLKTVVLATARYEVAEALCGELVLLSDGQVLAEGTLESLNQRLRDKDTNLKELYRSLCAAGRGIDA